MIIILGSSIPLSPPYNMLSMLKKRSSSNMIKKNNIKNKIKQILRASQTLMDSFPSTSQLKLSQLSRYSTRRGAYW